jgi:hypothetical protein
MTNWLAPWSRVLVEKLIVPAYQEVPHIVWKTTFHCHLHNIPSLAHIASYIIISLCPPILFLSDPL